jgi:hypothetical protein
MMTLIKNNYYNQPQISHEANPLELLKQQLGSAISLKKIDDIRFNSFHSNANLLAQCYAQTNNSATRNKLNSQVLHLHSKDAKYPLWICRDHHLSPLFEFESTKNSYMRSSGCGLHKLEKFLLTKEPHEYSFLFNEKSILSAGYLVQSPLYLKLLKGHYIWQKTYGKRDNKPESFEERLQFLKKTILSLEGKDEPIFIDVSRICQDSPDEKLPADVLQARLTQIKEAIPDPSHIICGGVLQLNHLEYFAFALTRGDANLTEIKKPIKTSHKSKNINYKKTKLLNPKTNKPRIDKVKDDMKTLRSQGFVPDIVTVEQALYEIHNLNAENLINKVLPRRFKASKDPEIHNYSTEELKHLHSEVLSTLKTESDSASSSKNFSREFYYTLIIKILENLSIEDLNIQDVDNKPDQGAINAIGIALSEINDVIQSAANHPHLFQFVHDVDYIFEQIILMSRFSKEKDLNALIAHLSQVDTKASEANPSQVDEKASQANSSQVDEKASQANSSQAKGAMSPHAFSYTSCQSAITQILTAVHKTVNMGKEKKEPVKALFSDASYHELLLFHNPRASKHLSITTDNIGALIENGKNMSHYDLIAVDMIPNKVTLDETRIFDIKKLLPLDDLKKRSSPMTLIIDTTASIFYDKSIQEVVKHYQDPINSGMLNLILVNSLEKFAQCGLSKFPGGAAVIYSKNDYLIKKAERYSNIQHLSQEAQNFFHLFLSIDNGKFVTNYLNKINDSTASLYGRLGLICGFKDAKGNPPLFEVIKREPSDPIPMIAVHFDGLMKRLEGLCKDSVHRDEREQIEEFINKMTALDERAKKNIINSRIEIAKRKKIEVVKEGLGHLIVYWILLNGAKNDLSMMMRSSFGFPHANLTMCKSALRLCAGLEDEIELDKYAELLQNIDISLSALVSKGKLDEIAGNIFEIVKDKKHFENNMVEILLNPPKLVNPSKGKPKADEVSTFSDFVKYVANASARLHMGKGGSIDANDKSSTPTQTPSRNERGAGRGQRHEVDRTNSSPSYSQRGRGAGRGQGFHEADRRNSSSSYSGGRGAGRGQNFREADRRNSSSSYSQEGRGAGRGQNFRESDRRNSSSSYSQEGRGSGRSQRFHEADRTNSSSSYSQRGRSAGRGQSFHEADRKRGTWRK